MNNKEKDTIQLNKTKLRALLPAIKKLDGFLTKTTPGKCKINADADFDEEFMKGRWTKSDLEILRQIIQEEVQPLKDDMAVLKQDNEILKKDNEVLRADNQFIKIKFSEIKEMVEAIRNCPTIKKELKEQNTSI